MTDTDRLSRDLDDLRKRVEMLERERAQGRFVTWAELRSWQKPPPDMGGKRITPAAPDGPSHADPLGR